MRFEYSHSRDKNKTAILYFALNLYIYTNISIIYNIYVYILLLTKDIYMHLNTLQLSKNVIYLLL